MYLCSLYPWSIVYCPVSKSTWPARSVLHGAWEWCTSTSAGTPRRWNSPANRTSASASVGVGWGVRRNGEQHHCTSADRIGYRPTGWTRNALTSIPLLASWSMSPRITSSKVLPRYSDMPLHTSQRARTTSAYIYITYMHPTTQLQH